MRLGICPGASGMRKRHMLGFLQVLICQELKWLYCLTLSAGNLYSRQTAVAALKSSSMLLHSSCCADSSIKSSSRSHSTHSQQLIPRAAAGAAATRRSSDRPSAERLLQQLQPLKRCCCWTGEAPAVINVEPVSYLYCAPCIMLPQQAAPVCEDHL